jgi:hypothetical protein
MASEISMALEELVRKAQVSDDIDFLREGVHALAQALMEAEVTQHLGAGRYERTAGRTGERTGSRERRWDTRVGSITLRVPRVRDSSYFPSLLEPRRRAERALGAVVQEAYVQGGSTRRVDELVQALELSGISKSQVSVLCQELDGEVERFRTRPLGTAPYPYVWLDATYVKARINGHVASQAVVIAIGLNAATATREVLGAGRAARARMARSGWPSCVGWWPTDWPAFSWWSVMPTKGSKPRLRRCCMEPGGNAVGCTLCAMRSPWCPKPPSSWWPRRFGPCLPNRIRRWRGRRGARSPTASVPAIPSWRRCSMRRRAMSWRIGPSRVTIGGRSGVIIPWSG